MKFTSPGLFIQDFTIVMFSKCMMLAYLIATRIALARLMVRSRLDPFLIKKFGSRLYSLHIYEKSGS